MLQELFAHLTQSSCWCCHCAGGAAELPCFHSEPRRGGGSPGEPPPPPPAVRSVRGCPCTAEASEASTGRSHGIQFDLEVQWGSRLGFQCPICQLSSTVGVSSLRLGWWVCVPVVAFAVLGFERGDSCGRI